MIVPKVFTPERSKYLVITTTYIFPTILSLVLVIALYLLFFSSLFQIKKIECQLDFEACQNEAVLAEISKSVGQNIFNFQTVTLSTRLTSGDFTIREATIHKVLPSQINVELQSVYPVVALKLADDQNWVIMDQKYRVIATKPTPPNVPTLIIPGPLTLKLGQPPEDENIRTSLSMARRLSEKLVGLKNIRLVDQSTIELDLESGLQVLMTTKKDEALQIKTLQAILSEGTISSEANIIDVRFSQPVLR